MRILLYSDGNSGYVVPQGTTAEPLTCALVRALVPLCTSRVNQGSQEGIDALSVTVYAEAPMETQSLSACICSVMEQLEHDAKISFRLHPDSGSKALHEREVARFDCAVWNSHNSPLLVHFNEFCRAHNVQFISFFTMGYAANVFYDGGSTGDWRITTDPESIVEIRKVSPKGKIRLDPDVSIQLAEGDWVKIYAVENDQAYGDAFGAANLLNGQAFRVAHVIPSENAIVLDLSSTLANYKRALKNYRAGSGVLEKAVAHGSKEPWLSLEATFVRPSADITKASCYEPDQFALNPAQLHFAMAGVQNFLELYGSLPQIGNDTDAEEAFDLAQRALRRNCEVNRSLPSTAFVVASLDEESCQAFASQCCSRVPQVDRCVCAIVAAVIMNPEKLFRKKEQILTFSLPSNHEDPNCTVVDDLLQLVSATPSPN